MIAAFLLVLALAFPALARDNGEAAESFRVAARHASDSVGTPAFPKALFAAELACDDRRVPGCAVILMTLEEVNALAHRAAASVPVAAEVESEPARRVPSGPRVVLVGQPTGLQYVGGKKRPSAPWTGLELTGFDRVVDRDADGPDETVRVCVMMDGAPVPMGAEVPFSHMDAYGASVVGCPAASVAPGEPLYVPDGATVEVAVLGRKTKDVFVVQATYRCEQVRDDVQRKSVTSCHGG